MVPAQCHVNDKSATSLNKKGLKNYIDFYNRGTKMLDLEIGNFVKKKK
jgi:hypothetical protein